MAPRRHDPRLTVFPGDILLPNMGLSQAELDALRTNVTVVIHAASSLNMAKPLDRMAPAIVGSSETVTDIALSFASLDRFVYISSASSNAHLLAIGADADVKIDEKIHDLPLRRQNPQEEWAEIQATGTSAAYSAVNFPTAYAYAKHLTERLLLHKLGPDRLLVVRPSIIRPAQQLPFPGFCVPMSAPLLVFAAAMCLVPRRRIRISTLSQSPETNVHVDTVPVDVVVDRLLAHLAVGTKGAVHAVAGAKARFASWEFWRVVNELRRISWGVRAAWVRSDWHDPAQHAMARLHKVIGTSVVFLESRSAALRDSLGEKEGFGLQLFTEVDMTRHTVMQMGHVRYVMGKFAQRSLASRFVMRVLYRDLGK